MEKQNNDRRASLFLWVGLAVCVVVILVLVCCRSCKTGPPLLLPETAILTLVVRGETSDYPIPHCPLTVEELSADEKNVIPQHSSLSTKEEGQVGVQVRKSSPKIRVSGQHPWLGAFCQILALGTILTGGPAEQSVKIKERDEYCLNFDLEVGRVLDIELYKATEIREYQQKYKLWPGGAFPQLPLRNKSQVKSPTVFLPKVLNEGDKNQRIGVDYQGQLAVAYYQDGKRFWHPQWIDFPPFLTPAKPETGNPSFPSIIHPRPEKPLQVKCPAHDWPSKPPLSLKLEPSKSDAVYYFPPLTITESELQREDIPASSVASGTLYWETQPMAATSKDQDGVLSFSLTPQYDMILLVDCVMTEEDLAQTKNALAKVISELNTQKKQQELKWRRWGLWLFTGAKEFPYFNLQEDIALVTRKIRAQIALEGSERAAKMLGEAPTLFEAQRKQDKQSQKPSWAKIVILLTDGSTDFPESLIPLKKNLSQKEVSCAVIHLQSGGKSLADLCSEPSLYKEIKGIEWKEELVWDQIQQIEKQIFPQSK